MKKSIIYLAALVSLIMLAPQQADAQFLKKLGEALIGGITGSSTNESHVPGIGINWTECVRWGEDVNMSFTMTNQTNADIRMKFYNTWPSGDDRTYAIANNGDKYEVEIISLGGKSTTTTVVPARTTIKCIARIKKAAGKVKKFKYISIGGWNSDQKNRDFAYISSSMEVQEARNTNRENLKCTLPSLIVNEKSIVRDGSSVHLTFELLQNTGNDMNVHINEISIYSNNGDAFSGTTSTDNVKLISGIPVKTGLNIKNVPTGTVFSIIRISIGDNYLIEWRNVTAPGIMTVTRTNTVAIVPQLLKNLEVYVPDHLAFIEKTKVNMRIKPNAKAERQFFTGGVPAQIDGPVLLPYDKKQNGWYHLKYHTTTEGWVSGTMAREGATTAIPTSVYQKIYQYDATKVRVYVDPATKLALCEEDYCESDMESSPYDHHYFRLGRLINNNLLVFQYWVDVETNYVEREKLDVEPYKEPNNMNTHFRITFGSDYELGNSHLLDFSKLPYNIWETLFKEHITEGWSDLYFLNMDMLAQKYVLYDLNNNP